METPAEICENYQLKWSSYTSYIHSCIASSLFAEDSFADVALVTMDGHKIMAHRFVLSYSSQYLNKALKFQPKVTTALPIMIVLPQGKFQKLSAVFVTQNCRYHLQSFEDFGQVYVQWRGDCTKRHFKCGS